MADEQIPAGVTIEMDRDTVAATTTVDAPPADVFDFIRRPANHLEISGDESVKGTAIGPDVLSEGDRFGMRMKMYGLPYKVTSEVVEFQQGTRIAWCHFGGHRWRWDLEATPEGGTRLTETFDLSTAKVPAAIRLMGYPKGHRPNVASSVANVAAHFAPA
ncbi:MAG: SRPBCC family protein [Iamia sp.]